MYILQQAYDPYLKIQGYTTKIQKKCTYSFGLGHLILVSVETIFLFSKKDKISQNGKQLMILVLFHCFSALNVNVVALKSLIPLFMIIGQAMEWSGRSKNNHLKQENTSCQMLNRIFGLEFNLQHLITQRLTDNLMVNLSFLGSILMHTLLLATRGGGGGGGCKCELNFERNIIDIQNIPCSCSLTSLNDNAENAQW